MCRLNTIFSPVKLTKIFFLLTALLISILGCGEQPNSDTTLDKPDYDVKYENKELLIKPTTEDINTTNNNKNSSDSTLKFEDTIKSEQTIPLESDIYEKQLGTEEVSTQNNLSLVFLYSDYWIGCQRAKPIVDQLEIELDPDIDIKRIDILTEYGNEFSNEYSLSTPGFILLNDSNKELLRFTGVPNKSQFAESLKEYI